MKANENGIPVGMFTINAIMYNVTSRGENEKKNYRYNLGYLNKNFF